MKLCMSGCRLLVNSLYLEADGKLPDYRYTIQLCLVPHQGSLSWDLVCNVAATQV